MTKQVNAFNFSGTQARVQPVIRRASPPVLDAEPVTQYQPTADEQLAEMARKLAAAEAALAEAKASAKGAPRKVTCKVTEKGGLSAYGMGRFPITLYKSQWQKLIAEIDTVKAALIENDHLLTVKE